MYTVSIIREIRRSSLGNIMNWFDCDMDVYCIRLHIEICYHIWSVATAIDLKMFGNIWRMSWRYVCIGCDSTAINCVHCFWLGFCFFTPCQTIMLLSRKGLLGVLGENVKTLMRRSIIKESYSGRRKISVSFAFKFFEDVKRQENKESEKR